MSFSSYGSGMGPGTIGTLGFMSNYAKNSPEFRQLQGVQQTLQFANHSEQRTVDLLSYNFRLSNMKPGDKDYARTLALRNSILYGGPSLQGFGGSPIQNLEHIKNPKLRFAIGILSIVKRFLGAW